MVAKSGGAKVLDQGASASIIRSISHTRLLSRERAAFAGMLPGPRHGLQPAAQARRSLHAPRAAQDCNEAGPPVPALFFPGRGPRQMALALPPIKERVQSGSGLAALTVVGIVFQVARDRRRLRRTHRCSGYLSHPA